MNILFIGNSHTFTNDVPLIVKNICHDNNLDITYDTIAKPGVSLLFHSTNQETLNYLKNDYDYVVLQEVASSYNNQNFINGFKAIYPHINTKKTKIILYMVWSIETDIELQYDIINAHNYISSLYHTLIANAGEVLLDYRLSKKEVKIYKDGNHLLPLGSYIAASTIYYALTSYANPIIINDNNQTIKDLNIKVSEAIEAQNTILEIHKNNTI